MVLAQYIEVADPSEAVEECYRLGWAADGLPVVPPTEPRILAMLAGTRREAGEAIGQVPPAGGQATVEKVAINAVMAGCLPEYLPVILAALEAMLDPAFNLNGMQATTHVCAPLVIVNGPIRKGLDLNAGAGVFGPGWRANATIGRALRLILLNLGGATPGILDKSTLGHPGKYTYCIAENEEASPWEPLHAERGFARDASAVTVLAAEAPHSVTNHVSNDARGILLSAADTMAAMGTNNMSVMGETLLVVGPEHAGTIRKDGWSKDDVRRFLFEVARRPLRQLTFDGAYGPIYNRNWPRWVDRSDPETRVPAVERPEDILVIVAGGPAGRFSAVVPGWGWWTRAVTRPVAV
jgi:hypothetical protein